MWSYFLLFRTLNKVYCLYNQTIVCSLRENAKTLASSSSRAAAKVEILRDLNIIYVLL